MAQFAARYRSELRLVVQALTATALSLLIAEALALPQGFWAVITALIIVQGSLGGTLGAGLDRVVGTLAGAALGAAAALARVSWDVPLVVLLVLAVAPVALLAAIRQSFRVAPVTAAIVLLASSGTASPLAAALDRVGEIALGTVVAIVVSMLVLPSRARGLCFALSAELLDLFAQLLALHLQPPDGTKCEAIDRLNKRVRDGLGKLATAAQEAHREHAIRVTGEPVPDRLLRTLRRLRIDVVFVLAIARSSSASLRHRYAAPRPRRPRRRGRVAGAELSHGRAMIGFRHRFLWSCGQAPLIVERCAASSIERVAVWRKGGNFPACNAG
jgi:uncharacterized membrane protein YccC